MKMEKKLIPRNLFEKISLLDLEDCLYVLFVLLLSLETLNC